MKAQTEKKSKERKGLTYSYRFSKLMGIFPNRRGFSKVFRFGDLNTFKYQFSMEWNQQVYYPLQGKTIFNYFALLSVAFHDIYSIFGFFVFLIVINQLISGTMLSFSLVLEPMIVPMVREEEDVEDLYIDDFFLTSRKG